MNPRHPTHPRVPARRRLAGTMLACLLTGAAPSHAAPVKQVAAPPSDITDGIVALPDPLEQGVLSRTALVPVRLDAGSWAAEFDLGDARAPVLAVLTADADDWRIALSDPAARPVASPGFGDTPRQSGQTRVVRVDGALGQLAPDAAGARLTLEQAATGRWRVTLTAQNPDAPADGFLLIDPGSPATLYTTQTAAARPIGRPLTLHASVMEARLTDLAAEVRMPSGRVFRVAGDPATGLVEFTPDEPGDHAVRVEARAADTAGRSVLLTTQHLLHAAPAAPALRVAESQVTDGTLRINLGPGLPGQRTITAAEVWGRRDGVMVPVCWLSRLTEADRSLSLDLRWVAMAGVDPASLELRSVRSHEVVSYGVVASAVRLALPRLAEADLHAARAALPAEPTPDMLGSHAGDLDSPLVDSPGVTNRAILPGHRLFLVHGYCSGGNPFPESDFSGDLSVFADPDQNRTHDEFAQIILVQGAPMKSYGIVGHSQGGMAALHLRTYYWSGLDWAQGERLIQTVGTPYQGTPLAGDAAALGTAFGTGCGGNADLAPDGAAAWLSLIPTAARADVWYWTTSFTDRPFLLDFCNFLTGLLLTDPDDGVIERFRAQLPGANNQGHTEGWCHTSGMRDPAQTTDAARNAEMNERARR